MIARLEVVTRGDPARALYAALAAAAPRGALTMATTRHDDGCPCTSGQPRDMSHCTCEIVLVELETEER